jgi:hypothetical protein
MGLLDRLATRKTEPDEQHRQLPSDDDPVFATKALRKFLSCLTSREIAGPRRPWSCRGSNVSFFGEQLWVQDLRRGSVRRSRSARPCRHAGGPAGVSQETISTGSRQCRRHPGWDLIDYLGRAAAQELAGELTRVLRPDGALLGFFGTAQTREARYTKFIIADEVNLKHRSYEAARGVQAILLNRDIIKLFAGLRAVRFLPAEEQPARDPLPQTRVRRDDR